MIRVCLLCVLIAALGAGCGKSNVGESRAAGSTRTNLQTYQVRGVVTAVKPKEKSVEIRHEDIPGVMPAMRMPFDVRDTNELAGLGAGDPVTFRLTVTDTDSWVDQIRKTGPRTNLLPVAGPIRITRDVEPLNEGDRLPEFRFTNQFGEAFSSAQFNGQALAINFIFTRCPLPTMCPQTARYFAATQQKLLARPNGPTNWHLVTISFDPEVDTPAVLKAYAERQHADPQRWTFATGAPADITAFGDQFGLVVIRDTPGGAPTHNLRTVVVDATGRVQKIIPGNEWTSDELVAEMLKAAAAK